MNHNPTTRRCLAILVTFSLLQSASLRFIPCGYLKVEPGTPFHLGSNLTVWCHVTECPGWLNWFDISLRHNSEVVLPLRRVNHTTVVFSLPKVEMPKSTVICKVDQLSRIVNGLDLRAALPPEKPRNITCETTNGSEVIECSWRKGWDSDFPTFYNISVYGENETTIYLDRITAAEKTTIPKRMFDTNTKYVLIITAHNDFGVSESDPFTLCLRDAVTPVAPQITRVGFQNGSTVATLCWKTSESSDNLRPLVRLRTGDTTWAVQEGRLLTEGLMQTDDLKPLTEYEFQMRTCESAGASTHNASHTTMRTRCSKWSSSVRKTSPGKAPSQQLDVWRTLHTPGARGMRMVTVLWKPPPPEDYSGEVQLYKISWASGHKHEVTCSADAVQWTGQVSSEVDTLTVAASTSYGATPPAHVTLTHSDILGPALRDLTPSLSGRGLLVSWSRPVDSGPSTLEAELLYYVMEWTSVPAAGLQWERLSKDLQNTTISGLTAGVGYRVSLHAVTSRVVSAPSSRLAYSVEKTPLSGPELSVLAHDKRKVLIQWEELPVHQQRGSLTKYTVYIHRLDSAKAVLNVTVSASGPRQMWLDCPPGALALWMTGSTSAGEGPPGKVVSSEPAAFSVDLVIVVVFIFAVLIAITANLMCWSCIRERIKQKCVSWGPEWFVDNLPNVGHSNAIRLLKRDENEPLFSSSVSETPLSPITVVSQEARDDAYPTIHVSVTPMESERPAVETPAGSTLEHFDYRPQTASFAPQGREVSDEEQRSDSPAHGEEDGCAFVFGELTGGLLFDGVVDFLDSPPGPAHSSVSGPVWPTTAVTTVATEQSVGGDFLSLDLQQEDVTTPDTADWPEATVNGGYFPQLVAARRSMM